MVTNLLSFALCHHHDIAYYSSLAEEDTDKRAHQLPHGDKTINSDSLPPAQVNLIPSVPCLPPLQWNWTPPSLGTRQRVGTMPSTNPPRQSSHTTTPVVCSPADGITKCHYYVSILFTCRSRPLTLYTLRPSGLNRAKVCRRDMNPCSMSRNLSPSKGSINFFSRSSSSLYHEMFSDVSTNQYGREPPEKPPARHKHGTPSFISRPLDRYHVNRWLLFSPHRKGEVKCAAIGRKREHKTADYDKGR